MPGTTSYRPCLAVSLHCRHRRGATDGGASPVRNEYRSLSHTTRPSAALTTHGVSAAMNPRLASAKSAVSSRGSRRFRCADAITAVGALWFTGQTLPLLHPCWKRQLVERLGLSGDSVTKTLFGSHRHLTGLGFDAAIRLTGIRPANFC